MLAATPAIPPREHDDKQGEQGAAEAVPRHVDGCMAGCRDGARRRAAPQGAAAVLRTSGKAPHKQPCQSACDHHRAQPAEFRRQPQPIAFGMEHALLDDGRSAVEREERGEVSQSGAAPRRGGGPARGYRARSSVRKETSESAPPANRAATGRPSISTTLDSTSTSAPPSARVFHERRSRRREDRPKSHSPKEKQKSAHRELLTARAARITAAPASHHRDCAAVTWTPRRIRPRSPGPKMPPSART